MVREDLINFVLENIILTLGRWGFPDDIFQYLHFFKIYEVLAYQILYLKHFQLMTTLTVSYKNIYKSNSKRYDHTVMTADKDYHRN